MAFGGPIKRDRLWFYSVGRGWGKEAVNGSNLNIWDNKNAGIWGMNYQPDRSQPPLNLHQLDAQRQRAHHVSSLAQRTSSTSSGTRG